MFGGRKDIDFLVRIDFRCVPFMNVTHARISANLQESARPAIHAKASALTMLDQTGAIVPRATFLANANLTVHCPVSIVPAMLDHADALPPRATFRVNESLQVCLETPIALTILNQIGARPTATCLANQDLKGCHPTTVALTNLDQTSVVPRGAACRVEVSPQVCLAPIALPSLDQTSVFPPGAASLVLCRLAVSFPRAPTPFELVSRSHSFLCLVRQPSTTTV